MSADDFKVGEKVHYKPNFGSPENGIVKSKHSYAKHFVFVVYSCGGDWENYQNYTAACTSTADLRKGWV